MAKLQSFTLRDFKEPSKIVYNIKVPIESIFRKCILIPGSIIVVYEMPELDFPIDELDLLDVDTRLDKFKILENNQDIPKNSTFIDVMNAITENEDKEQVVILLPIYKLI